MDFLAGKCDIAVIGAGHAGIEAALAGARLGMSVICSPEDKDEVVAKLEAEGFKPFVMGECMPGEGKVTYR